MTLIRIGRFRLNADRLDRPPIATRTIVLRGSDAARLREALAALASCSDWPPTAPSRSLGLGWRRFF